jgi:ATP-dependent helicase Lhr and Lhr-like helicase
MYEESLAKVLRTRVDPGPVSAMLRAIRDGGAVVVEQKVSHLGQLGVQPYRTMLRPEIADRGVLLALKNRLEGESVRLLCLSCGTSRRAVVGDIRHTTSCNKCRGRMLAAVPTYDRTSQELVGRKDLTVKQRKKLKWLFANATLVNSYGKRAVLALAGRGIGPGSATRILMQPFDDEVDFLREILRAEVRYARTRRFWD